MVEEVLNTKNNSQQVGSQQGSRKLKLFFMTVVGVLMFACSLPASPAATPVTVTEAAAPTQSEAVQIPQIQTVTIKTGVDLNKPAQYPTYWLQTWQGHYLLYVTDTQTLIYDGANVHTGQTGATSSDWSGGMALSNTGAHYAYVEARGDGSNINNLYVDGVNVASAEFLDRPAMTNDGQHYFYTACSTPNGSAGGCLFKDDAQIFSHSDGIMEYWISDDGSTYFASLRNFDASGGFVESLVRNGEEIYQGQALHDKKFSHNGQHYAYVSLDVNTNQQSLVVDGSARRSSSALFVQQVTDLGAFCGWDSAQKKVYINDREIPAIQDSNVRCYINEDASHFLIYDGGWTLDGQPVQLDANVKSAEFVDGVLYVYTFVQ